MQVRKQVRNGHGTKDWFQIGKAVCQGCILSPCLFNLYKEYITRQAFENGVRMVGFFRFNFIGVLFIYNAMLVPGVQQSDSVKHVHVFIPFQILFSCKLSQNTE